MAIWVVSVDASAKEYTFMELYSLARDKDPQVARSQARLDSTVADKDIAYSAILPHISGNASVKQFWHEVTGYASGPINGEYTGYSYGAGGSIYLLNIPSYYQIGAAKTGIKSAEANIKYVGNDLAIRIIDAYMKALKAAADENLYKEEKIRMTRVLEQAEAFLKAGTGDVIAVYEAKAKLDSAAADMVRAQGQHRMALQQLSSLTGIIVENITDLSLQNTAFKEPEALQWWLDTMQERNPAILQAKLDLRQAEQNTSATRAGHYPTLQANGGYTVDKGSTFLPDVETQQWYTGIGLSVPIYSGGETRARQKKTQAAEKERRAMLDDTIEMAIKKLKETYLNLQYTKSLLDAYQKKIESAKMQLQAIQKGRTLGTRTAIDLLNAEQSYSIAARDLTSTKYDSIQHGLELKAAAGILTERDLAEIFVK